jgi:hypothetical protein
MFPGVNRGREISIYFKYFSICEAEFGDKGALYFRNGAK